MAQIFISHSKQDKDLLDFFLRAFAGTKVNPVLEELEALLHGEISKDKIRYDIDNSNALFILLSHNVHGLPHTRDWVVWEAGIAKNKDIWVFERLSDLGTLSVIIPHLRHYLLYDLTDDWMTYVKRIIMSYDDSSVLPTVIMTGLAGACLGAAASDGDSGGALFGGLAGAVAGTFLSDKSNRRPMGVSIVCERCRSSYNVHAPEGIVFRCPSCNAYLRIGR